MEDAKLEKWYESKVAFLVASLSPLVLVLIFLFNMKTDIALIQQSISNINSNHEAHIQDILQEIKELRSEQVTQQSEIIELQKNLLVLMSYKGNK